LLAEGAPVVVAVDDRHWLDRATRDVVEFVRRRLVGEPVGFLETTRPEPETVNGAAAQAGEGIDVLELGPLSPGALHELVRERFGRAFPRPTLMRIHEIPLHVHVVGPVDHDLAKFPYGAYGDAARRRPLRLLARLAGRLLEVLAQRKEEPKAARPPM
jgi:hypothetical protein